MLRSWPGGGICQFLLCLGGAEHWPGQRIILQVRRGHASHFGPSRVRALPLAAGINEGGHYFRYIIGPSVLRAPAEQTKVATVFGN